MHLRRTAVVAFIAGAVLLLFGGIGAFYLWKVTEKEAISAHYSRNIDIKMIEDDSDAGEGKIVEVQDFKAGITAVKFPGKEKCYIKSQVRTELSEEEDTVAVKSEVASLVWIASEEPLKDNSFLSPEILRFCGDLPIYWHHLANARALRKRRSVTRVRRQSTGGLTRQQARRRNSTSSVREEERPTGPEYNPENPYHLCFGSLSSVYDPDFLSKWVHELQPLVQAFGQHLFLLLSEPRASYHGCPALLSAPTSILLILVVCSKNRFVEAKTNAEKNQSCVSLHQSRKQPAIVGAVSTVLTFPMKGSRSDPESPSGPGNRQRSVHHDDPLALPIRQQTRAAVLMGKHRLGFLRFPPALSLFAPLHLGFHQKRQGPRATAALEEVYPEFFPPYGESCDRQSINLKHRESC
ncbi:Leukocyte cell-derived chemotaxin 1 [Anabarilius grahami]|uniref:Leukocyte cell-derived chemotaxin 1 n=1 Tax=Anabarilius grahami TaxID=495550 RepID=A0A3N0YLZ4_ANAGA|nr:Leukocyte cell-derived chemotaxin 1 [Anabarilius grahami]